VQAISDSWSLREASVFLERLDRTGAPVADAAGNVCGFLSLRDIMKARRSGQMQAPVRSYMIRSVFTGSPSTTLREIESIFFQHTIFYLPIVVEGKLVGIVTRSEYLAARAGRPEAVAAAAGGPGSAGAGLPAAGLPAAAAVLPPARCGTDLTSDGSSGLPRG
jgi:CBS domain-containing protein